MNMKKYLCILLCALLLSAGVTASAQNEWEEVSAGILDFAAGGDVQGWIDGELSEAPAGDAAWFVLGLAQKPGADYDFSAYAAALQRYVNENETGSATSRQKYALAFLASGHHSAYIESTAQDALGGLGIMSWVMGLQLIRNGYEGGHSAEEAVAEILSRQLNDGGWAVAGTNGDVDVTAMTIQALAPYCGEESVQSAVDSAVSFLSSGSSPPAASRPTAWKTPRAPCRS